MIDPFEEVEPVPPINPEQALTIELARSMMWDMIGPYRIRDEPTRFGQQPASMDVLEAEAREMWARKYAMVPFGLDFPMLCYIAAESASTAIMVSEGFYDTLSPEDQMKFRIGNIKLGTSIAESVIGHMLQKGLIKYGDNNEFLERQA